MSHPAPRTADGLLRVIRERGWKITEAADYLGVPYTTLIGIRDGHHRPGLVTMDRVEAALPEYTHEWLFPKDKAREEHSDATAAAAG